MLDFNLSSYVGMNKETSFANCNTELKSTFELQSASSTYNNKAEIQAKLKTSYCKKKKKNARLNVTTVNEKQMTRPVFTAYSPALRGHKCNSHLTHSCDTLTTISLLRPELRTYRKHFI